MSRLPHPSVMPDLIRHPPLRAKRPCRSSNRRHDRGAALLSALLTVTLVATLAAGALWQQWRGVEVEAAERQRARLAWILLGALDWARLILREDARGSQIDHLSEPWALPLQEARLASFLALEREATEDTMQAFLSGRITDLQGRMNLANLVEGGQVSAPARAAFARLFTQLGLPPAQLDLLIDGLRQAHAPAQPAAASAADAPLLPQRFEQLGALGLPPSTLRALAPHVTLLPLATPLNLNTASVEAVQASLGLEPGRAQTLLNQRALAHFRSVTEALEAAGHPPVEAARLSVSSRFFEVRGRLRLEQTVVQERSLLERQGQDVRVLWRVRESVHALMTEPERSLQ